MKKYKKKPCTKKYVWNPVIWAFENDKHLRNIISDLVVTCDEIREPTKNITKNFGNEKATCKIYNFYILLAFY